LFASSAAALDSPPTVLDDRPAVWEDLSASPDQGIRIWVDHPDPRQRERKTSEWFNRRLLKGVDQ
jgi:hypothetical protein